MKRGATLVEVLIVIVIISFLTVLVVAYLRTQVFKANDARRKADIKKIGTFVEEYEKDNNCYPLPSLVVCNPGTELLPYIDKIPCDPVSNSSYFYIHEDSMCPKWFKLYTKLENESDQDYLIGIGPNSVYNYVLGSPNAPVDAIGEATPAPSGEPVVEDNFFGCFSGVCTPISWDSSRPGPECDPSFQNLTCYGQCTNINNECQPWNQ